MMHHGKADVNGDAPHAPRMSISLRLAEGPRPVLQYTYLASAPSRSRLSYRAARVSKRSSITVTEPRAAGSVCQEPAFPEIVAALRCVTLLPPAAKHAKLGGLA